MVMASIPWRKTAGLLGGGGVGMIAVWDVGVIELGG